MEAARPIWSYCPIGIAYRDVWRHDSCIHVLEGIFDDRGTWHNRYGDAAPVIIRTGFRDSHEPCQKKEKNSSINPWH